MYLDYIIDWGIESRQEFYQWKGNKRKNEKKKFESWIKYLSLSIFIFPQPKDQKFVYPDIFPKDKTEQGQKETDKSVGELKKSFQQYLDRNKERPGVPNWFTI